MLDAAYRKASMWDLRELWERNVRDHPDDLRWERWRREYLAYHERGMAQTYVVVIGVEPVGEGTLLFSPKCRAIRGRTFLADGRRTVNLNALRIRSRFEGQGYISKLVRLMEREAREAGFERITIGVETSAERTAAIYRHWGYDRVLSVESEDSASVTYLCKVLTGGENGT